MAWTRPQRKTYYPRFILHTCIELLLVEKDPWKEADSSHTFASLWNQPSSNHTVSQLPWLSEMADIQQRKITCLWQHRQTPRHFKISKEYKKEKAKLLIFSQPFCNATSQNQSFLRRGKLDQFLKGQKKTEGIKFKIPWHGGKQAQCWTTSKVKLTEPEREKNAKRKPKVRKRRPLKA